MHDWIKPQYSLIVLCLFAELPAAVWGQDHLNSRSVETVGAFVDDNCFGIMGQIRQPGIYQFPAGPLTLARIIDEAGGLSPAAGRSIRIIRQGRSIQIFAGSRPHETLQAELLLPGDLVIVDERAETKHSSAESASRALPPASSGTNPPGPSGEQSSRIEVALLNVLSRPIIVDLDPEEATIEALWQRLQPQVSSLPQVKILSPGSPHPDPTRRLSSGTVLVFDSRSIDRERLPRLPPIVRVAADAGFEQLPPARDSLVRPHATKGAAKEFTSPTGHGDRTGAPVLAGPAFAAPRESATSVPPPPTDSTSHDDSPLSNFTETVAEAPPVPAPDSSWASGTRLFRSPNQRSEKSGSTNPEEVKGTPLVENSPSPARPALRKLQTKRRAGAAGRVQKGENAAEGMASSGIAGLERSQLTVLAGGFLLLVWGSILVYWIRTRRSRRTIRREVEPVPDDQSSELEMLIQNRVPLIEHSLSLPPQLEFHGRPAIGWKYRHDPAHSPLESAATSPAPHISRQMTEPARRELPAHRRQPVPLTHPSVREDVVQPVYPRADSPINAQRRETSASQDYMGIRPPRENSESAPPQGLLDRVLSTVHGISR